MITFPPPRNEDVFYKRIWLFELIVCPFCFFVTFCVCVLTYALFQMISNLKIWLTLDFERNLHECISLMYVLYIYSAFMLFLSFSTFTSCGLLC